MSHGSLRSRPIDETRNLDYLGQLYEDGHLVKLGDQIGRTAMRLEACRGHRLRPRLREPEVLVSRTYDPKDFRRRGVQQRPSTIHRGTTRSPVRFAETAAVLGLSNNVFDPAHVFSGFWLAAGLMLALLAGELLGVSRLPLVAAATTFAVAPDVLNSAAIINPDAAGVFAGGVVLVAALLSGTRTTTRRGGWR